MLLFLLGFWTTEERKSILLNWLMTALCAISYLFYILHSDPFLDCILLVQCSPQIHPKYSVCLMPTTHHYHQGKASKLIDDPNQICSLLFESFFEHKILQYDENNTVSLFLVGGGNRLQTTSTTSLVQAL